MRLDWRTEVRRYAAPFVLLVVVTVAALVVRGALRDDEPRAQAKPAAPKRTTPPPPAVKRAAGKLYLVERGDTLGNIADRFQTSVDRLLELNPDVDPRSLRVGQRVRVG